MLATKERSFYHTVCDTSKQHVHTQFTENGVFSPPPPFSSCEPCSMPGIAHYSFEMAQQVHYPSNPLQPGPIYFLTPRKCALFGVCCEAIPRQVNCLIDEASDTGKASNTVIAHGDITAFRAKTWSLPQFVVSKRKNSVRLYQFKGQISA